MLCAAGVVALRDETALQVVLMKGVEVVFLGVVVGSAGGSLVPAALDARCCPAGRACLDLLLHRPLALIPENPLQSAVGVLLLSAFGIFWIVGR